MAETRYPYKIRCQFTGRQEAGLRAAAKHHEIGILEMIRRYVVAGLTRDGITGEPPPTIDGQLTVDDTPEDTDQ